MKKEISQKIGFRVPSINKESVDAARRMLDNYDESSDEYKLAALIIDLEDGLETLLGDLKAQQKIWDSKRAGQ